MVILAAREDVQQVNAPCSSTNELHHAEEVEDGDETIVNGVRVSSHAVENANNQKTLTGCSRHVGEEITQLIEELAVQFGCRRSINVCDDGRRRTASESDKLQLESGRREGSWQIEVPYDQVVMVDDHHTAAPC